jgi:hypothetical protein
MNKILPGVTEMIFIAVELKLSRYPMITIEDINFTVGLVFLIKFTIEGFIFLLHLLFEIFFFVFNFFLTSQWRCGNSCSRFE